MEWNVPSRIREKTSYKQEKQNQSIINILTQENYSQYNGYAILKKESESGCL